MSGQESSEETANAGFRGWSPPSPGELTTLVLVRHGVTEHTSKKLFSGGLASSNPGLSEEGRSQVRATGEWLGPLRDDLSALVSSPVRRTMESAQVLAEVLGFESVAEEPGVAEMEFGAWDGLSFGEVRERHGEDLDAWLGSLDHPAGGTGESLRVVEGRVLEGAARLLSAYPGGTVAVVTHVTPIKVLVAQALGAPLEAVYRMELSPASVTVISYFGGGPDGDVPSASLRLFNARPVDQPFA